MSSSCSPAGSFWDTLLIITRIYGITPEECFRMPVRRRNKLMKGMSFNLEKMPLTGL